MLNIGARRARRLTRSVPWLLLSACACSNIIGISSYEIDPRLDPANGGSDAGSSGEAGDRTGNGLAGVGGAGDGGSSVGSGAIGGAAGAAGEPAVASGCRNDAECDDTIECTVDTCLPSGECEQLPDTQSCDAGNCEICTAGIGCVAGPQEKKQLLMDPKFDAMTSAWKQTGGPSIVESSLALSSPNLVQLGPAAADATEALYSDVFQAIKVPPGIAALSLTLNYRFTPGARKPPEGEYAVAALYERSADTPFTEFHQFIGTDAAQPTWKQVTYRAPRSQVARMAGKDFTFDLVAHSFDGVYLFDNVQLDATVCQ